MGNSLLRHNGAMIKHFAETSGHQRVVYGVLAGAAVGLMPLPLAWTAHALLAWCVGAATFLLLAWWLAVEFDAARTRQRAQTQDQPSLLLFAMLLASVFASTGAIAMLQQQVPSRGAVGLLGHLALSLMSLALSWLLMQTIFAFRYAHLYYQEELHGHATGAGLEFPGKLAPDYFDFLYYAHVVGMTSQVSDVVVTSRKMRRLTLLHSVSSFAFNMLVLALSINVMSSAIRP